MTKKEIERLAQLNKMENQAIQRLILIKLEAIHTELKKKK